MINLWGSSLCEIDHKSFLLFFCFIRDAEVIDLKRQAQSHQETLGKLHSEREDLKLKLQAGEGTNAALQQLQDQNVS